MPRRAEHIAVDLNVLGESCEWVHMLKDFPSMRLGRRHRKLFHDPKFTMSLILLSPFDPKPALSSLLHDVDDALFKVKPRWLSQKLREKTHSCVREIYKIYWTPIISSVLYNCLTFMIKALKNAVEEDRIEEDNLL